jgi:ABC-type transport system involved in cytochrome bd biosynthesis fused ATPase/permease subunit
VRIDGRDLFDFDLAAWRRTAAYLPQRPYLPERATVREAVRLIARSAADDAIRAALERVDLWAALAAHSDAPLDVKVATLSMGQKQRLALARTLAQDGRVVVLDEPDANLDAAGIDLVASLVRALASEGRSVVVAAHTDRLVAAADDVVDLGPSRRRAASGVGKSAKFS